VQLIELVPVAVVAGAVLAVLSLFALIASITKPSILLAVVTSILAGLALSVLVLAIALHEGHLSNCWTF
jgi:hypothetical protein